MKAQLKLRLRHVPATRVDTPEITLKGERLATSGAKRMGSDVMLRLQNESNLSFPGVNHSGKSS